MDEITYTLASYRVCSPEETWKKIEPILNDIGVTRIARIDGLDRVGIPVYSAIRPTAKEGAISVYSGKGATDIQARVSAAMEAIERYSAEQDEKTNVKTTQNPKNPIDVNELILPPNIKPNVDLWVEGYDIINDEFVEVPANAVFHPYEGRRLFRSNTNGLASGNTRDEAIFHGMLEVIERDAWSIAELSRRTYRGVNIEDAKNPLIHELMEKFRKAKINVILKDLTSEVGIPTIAAISDDDVLRDPALLCMGVGCHIHPEIAVLRALTEVAQSRATQIHGAREDAVRGDIVRKVSYERMKRIHKRWFEYKEEISISDIPNNAKLNLKKDMKFVKKRLVESGFERVIVVDLNKVGVDVVRVIIPKMEVYCIDRDRISPWARERIRNMVDKR
ncbi:YcaO-related McrA-glycine thioamidation protein [Methanotorris igneus]|uniref:Methanogenesis marker protein 1 n=1 Tax=Methanotorris igneus (strain DSM 5666 / JCM 11834 / Kol 5) TaxID=880724 RepID=F6BCR5_METIK|nr:YcaO-related McrA-glycine thioamidation protein [Methanotorris igneus]AEF96276.1 methanogenesis marker protein 1 [Methanotorris igneus Kol 5]